MAPQHPQISMFSTIFPPAPTFTAASLPSLTSKAFIITGAASGVGYELAKMLFLAGGTVYIGARSKARCSDAIDKLLRETEHTGKKSKVGKLESLVIDLADLGTVKPAVDSFLEKERRLDVLVHNAAVMMPPAGSVDKAGHDLEISTNCLGPYLLTLLLEPIIIRTAKLEAVKPGDVRILWVTSMLAHESGLPPGGMQFKADGTPEVLQKPYMGNYMQSKIGAAWLADKFARRMGVEGILSVALHPGLMKSELQRHWSFVQRWLMALLFKPATYGAYTELYAAFSPEVTVEDNGGYLTAWGRKSNYPKSVADGVKSKKDGGTGRAERFYQYCDQEIKLYL